MSNKNLNLFGLSASLALGLMLTACHDDLSEDAHYKTPDFLVGNAIEVLQKDGNYKTFLKGIELVGLKDVADSQILTVLAPTDEAFSAFLKEKGYNSIEEMHKADPKYTKQMIAYHLLYYAMDWEKMTNFRPSEGDAATELDKATLAGMYNRFRTRSVEDDEIVKNKYASIAADSLTFVHNDRYVTVFSEKMFNTLGIDAASNYNYFFPNTTWNPNHLKNGFNVMNAAVLDTAAVVTDNGYLYHIDHVLEPVGTIYEELKNRGNYDLICSLFDYYSNPKKYDTESTNRGYDVYMLSFSDNIPDIANEWPSFLYTDFATNSFQSWNLFIPTDQAMNRMFSEFWSEGCGYNDVLSLDPLIKKILLKQSLGYIDLDGSRNTSYMCFPDYIRQNKAVSYYDTDITTDPSTFDANLVCNNGVIYGSNTMDVPDVFSCVAGPSFKDVKYLTYLYALDKSGKLLSLSSKASDFITLIPDTAQFIHNEPAMRMFLDVTAATPTYELQEWSDVESDFVSASIADLEQLVNMNTTTAVKELDMEGVHVVETNEAFNYWYMLDGKITSNAVFNQLLNPLFKGDVWCDLQEIPCSTTRTQWSNGHAYAYNYSGIFMPASGRTLENELSQTNDRNYPYYCFAQLLLQAGLVDNKGFVTNGTTTIRLLAEMCRYFAFIPTNEAIKASLKDIPGCSSLSIDENTYVISGQATKSTLANYLLNYFVTADRVPFNAYPYVGSSCKGEFKTAGSYLLNLSDNGSKLSVSFSAEPDATTKPAGNVVDIVDQYHYLPFVFSDGAFHLIDQVLK